MNNKEYILSFILESSAGERRINRLVTGAKKALKAKDSTKADVMISKVMNKRDRKVNRAERLKRYLMRDKN